MQESVKRAIKAILVEARAKLNSQNKTREVIVDNSIIQTVLSEELARELDRLEDMLTDPVTFESKLKERCSKRSHDYAKTISLRFLPGSPANRLYWDVVKVVFKPDTMQEMFKITLPDVKCEYHLSLSKDASAPKIMPQPLSLAMPVEADVLPHFVITADAVFDTRQLAVLTATQQKQVQDQITSDFPGLRQCMNEVVGLREMFSNAHIKPPKPSTPRIALQRLLRTYQKGSSSITRLTYAPDATLVAIADFSDFLETLPVEVKTKLLCVNSGSRSLDSILKNEIYTGECSDHTSQLLNRLLSENRIPDDVLDVCLVNDAFSQDNTHPILSYHIPDPLVERLFPHMGTAKAMDVAEILAKIPAAFYSSYIRHHKNFNFIPLLAYVDSSTFNPDQVHAFVDALALHCPFHRRSTDVLQWIENFNSLSLWQRFLSRCEDNEMIRIPKYIRKDEVFKLILNQLSDEARCAFMVNREYINKWHLMIPYVNEERFKLMLASQFKEDKRALSIMLNEGAKSHPEYVINLVKSAAQSGELIQELSYPDFGWLMMIAHLGVFQAAVSHIGIKKLTQFIVESDDAKAVLFNVWSSVDVLAWIMDQLSEDQRIHVLTNRDKDSLCALDLYMPSDAVFERMVHILPQSRRFSLLTEHTERGSLLYRHAANPVPLRVFLNSLRPKMRLKAVLLPHQSSNTVHRAASQSDKSAFTALLMALLPEQRLPALLSLDQAAQGVIPVLRGNIATIKAALACLSEVDADKLLMHPHSSGETLFDSVISSNSSDVKKLLDKLSNHSLSTLFTPENIQYKSIFGSRLIMLMPQVIRRLPEKNRKPLVKSYLKGLIGNGAENDIFDIINLLPVADRQDVIQHILLLRKNSPQFQAMLLSLINPDKRLAVLRATIHVGPPSNEGTSILECLNQSETTLTSFINSLSKNDQRTLLSSRLKNGETLMQSRLNNKALNPANEIASWITSLNNDEACEFLQTSNGQQSLFQIYVNHAVKQQYSYDDVGYIPFVNFNEEMYRLSGTSRTFMQDMMNVVAYLECETRHLHKKMGFCGLFLSTPSSIFLADLRQCKKVDDFKIVLMNEFEKQNTVYRIKIANVLAAPKKHRDLSPVDELSQRWQMGEVRYRQRQRLAV